MTCRSYNHKKVVMPHWETVVYTYNPKTGDKATFAGDVVEAPSPRLAQMWLNMNGKGYMTVTGDKMMYDIEFDGSITGYPDPSLN